MYSNQLNYRTISFQRGKIAIFRFGDANIEHFFLLCNDWAYFFSLFFNATCEKSVSVLLETMRNIRIFVKIKNLIMRRVFVLIVLLFGFGSCAMDVWSASPRLSKRGPDYLYETEESKPEVVIPTAPAKPERQEKAAFPVRFMATDVEMLSFDKPLSDGKESFLLRNHTPYRISRVVLRLEYRSLSGEMIDYRDVTVDCDILPDKTRRLEIPSFDTSKRYYYVESGAGRKPGTPFRVYYDLLRYDIVVERPVQP